MPEDLPIVRFKKPGTYVLVWNGIETDIKLEVEENETVEWKKTNKRPKSSID